MPLCKQIKRKAQLTASLLVKLTPRNVNLGTGRFAMFNKERDILTNTAPGIMNRAEMENASAMGTGVEQTFCDQSEVYTVFPWVWKATGLGVFDGCLCIGCLEKRIGRTLTPDDFPQDHPFNIMPKARHSSKPSK